MRSLAFLIFIICSVPALAGFHGGGITNAWNGNLVLGEFDDPTSLPFVDLSKGTTTKLSNTVSGSNPDERQFNVEGWPSSFLYASSSACTAAGTNIWSWPVTIANGYRTGNITVQWTGCTYLHLNNGATINAGSVGQNPCGGGCSEPCVEVDSTDVSGVNCYLTYSSTGISSGNLQFKSFGDGTTDPQLTDVNEFYSSDASLMATCNTGRSTGNVTDLQSCWAPQLVADMRIYGAIRFINMLGENAGQPNSPQTTFEENVPLSYRGWALNNIHYVNYAELAQNQIQQSGGNPNEYTLSFPGLTIADRTNFQAQFAGTVTAPTATVSTSATLAGNCTGSPLQCTVFFNSLPADLVAGMTVSDGDGNTITFPTDTITSVNYGNNSVTFGCTNWVSAINGACDPIFSSATVAVSDTFYFSPLLSVNSGPFIPLGTNSGGALNSGNLTIAPNLSVAFTYLADMNLFSTGAGSNNSGIAAGIPIELTVALANAVGAHPYYNVPCYVMRGNTDYVHKMDAYFKAHLLPGLHPMWEGTDEIWNPDYFCYYTAGYEESYYQGGSSVLSFDAWYGAALSNIATQVSGDYGNPAAQNRSNYYRVIDAFAAQSDGAPPSAAIAFTGSTPDKRLSYAGDGNTPAYELVTNVSFASYFSSYMGVFNNTTATAQFLGTAYAYLIAPTETLIQTYLAGVNTSAAHDTLYALHNTTYPGFAKYIGAYANDSTHGGPYYIRPTQYEGGANPFPSYSTSTQTEAVTGITPGTTTTLAIATDNAFNYICNTYSLCSGGLPTVSLSGFTATNCTLNSATNVAVLSASSTGIVVDYDSSSGNSGCLTGTINIDNSGVWGGAFNAAAFQDLNPSDLYACELASMDDFWQQMQGQGLSPEFPGIYTMGGGAGSFSLARYWPSIYSPGGPTIPAVQAFNLSQSGPTSCSP